MTTSRLRTKPRNALLWRPRAKGGITFGHVPNPPGQPWYYEPHRTWYHVLAEDDEGWLTPVEPVESLERSPRDLHEALTGWDCVKKAISLDKKFMDRINTWMFVVLILALGFLAYLTMSEVTGP